MQQADVGRRDKKGKKGYDDKPPWTAICTTCFKEFPIHQMLFSSYENEEPVRAKYSPIELALGRARKSLKLKVPSGDGGQLLTRKWCPDKHELSQTAGLQKSLIIGLIGARYSGKTTYVAALIERLKSQVGQDMSDEIFSA